MRVNCVYLYYFYLKKPTAFIDAIILRLFINIFFKVIGAYGIMYLF